MKAGRCKTKGRAIAAAAALWMAAAAPMGAASSRDAARIVSYRSIDRAEVENLQRWVSRGHAEWCKDPRVVAAEELKRSAPDGGVEALALQAAGEEQADGAKKLVYEWAPLDGRRLYRVTVERFDWLLPLAGTPESLVWVPTAVEIVAED